MVTIRGTCEYRGWGEKKSRILSNDLKQINPTNVGGVSLFTWPHSYVSQLMTPSLKHIPPLDSQQQHAVLLVFLSTCQAVDYWFSLTIIFVSKSSTFCRLRRFCPRIFFLLKCCSLSPSYSLHADSSQMYIPKTSVMNQTHLQQLPQSPYFDISEPTTSIHSKQT